MEFMFDKFNLDISQLEGGEGCWDYSSNTDYGTVKAVLANSSLVTATNNTECLNANRMIGSINLNNPLNMTSNVKGYRLSWIIRKMGLKSIDVVGSNDPGGWGGGPFIPSFTLFE